MFGWRSCLDFASARRTRASKRGSTSGRFAETSGAGIDTCIRRIDSASRARNGTVPVASSYIITPHA